MRSNRVFYRQFIPPTTAAKKSGHPRWYGDKFDLKVKLTLLAYVNLWSARNLAVVLPRPWENYLTQNKSVKVTPSLVQRDFSRIISQIGTSAKSPKRRGYSSGRIKGYKKVPRVRHQVIKKQIKKTKYSTKVG